MKDYLNDKLFQIVNRANSIGFSCDRITSILSSESLPLNIVVFGDFNRGKSTLINALLGKVVLPTKLTPTTKINVFTSYHPIAQESEVHYDNGSIEKVRQDELSEIVTSIGANGSTIEKLVVYSDSLLLLNCNLVDTPGTNSSFEEAKIAFRAVRESDVVIFMVNCLQPLTENDLLNIKLIKDDFQQTNIIFVLNFLNLISDEDDQRKVIQRCSQKLSNISSLTGSKVFVVNVLSALKGKLHSNSQIVRESGLQALEKFLYLNVIEKHSLLKEKSTLQKIIGELESLRKENADIMSKFQKDYLQKKLDLIKNCDDKLKALENKLERLSSIKVSVSLSVSRSYQSITPEVKRAIRGEFSIAYCNDLVDKELQKLISVIRETIENENVSVLNKTWKVDLPKVTSNEVSGGGTLGGAAAGAAIGSFVPIIGTIAGGMIGGLVGLIKESTDAVEKDTSDTIQESESYIKSLLNEVEVYYANGIDNEMNSLRNTMREFNDRKSTGIPKSKRYIACEELDSVIADFFNLNGMS